MSRLRSILLSVSLVTRAFADGEVESFGLLHSPLGDGILDGTEQTLQVGSIGAGGSDGVASFFGEVAFGAFFFPNAYYAEPGRFMHAAAFGSVNGVTNAHIATLRGTNFSYGLYSVAADYSPIGATSLTFQVWQDVVKVAELTTTNGAFIEISANYALPPRVNPWWRQPNSEWGGAIEFHVGSVPGFILPTLEEVAGTRLFIRPNGATSVVDYVSRTDVVAGGQEMQFWFDDLQLGMFGHRHATLGDVKLDATNGVLTVSRFSLDNWEDTRGVQVQYDHAASGEVQLRPLVLALANTNEVQEQLQIHVSGYQGEVSGIAMATIQNSNGVLHISGTRYSIDQTLQVISNGVLVGTAPAAPYETFAIQGAPRLIGVRATADTLDASSSLGLFFDAIVPVSLPAGDVMGDSIVFVADTSLGVREVTGVALMAVAIPSFTIINELETSIIPRLTITWNGTNALLRWPNPDGNWIIQMRITHDEPWRDVEDPITHANGYSSVPWFMLGQATCFFRLRLATVVEED